MLEFIQVLVIFHCQTFQILNGVASHSHTDAVIKSGGQAVVVVDVVRRQRQDGEIRQYLLWREQDLILGKRLEPGNVDFGGWSCLLWGVVLFTLGGGPVYFRGGPFYFWGGPVYFRGGPVYFLGRGSTGGEGERSRMEVEGEVGQRYRSLEVGGG